MDQFGGILPDRDCPYFETVIEADRCRFLTLFSVQPGNQVNGWSQQDNVRIGTIGDERLQVAVLDSGLTVHSTSHNREWTLPFESDS